MFLYTNIHYDAALSDLGFILVYDIFVVCLFLPQMRVEEEMFVITPTLFPAFRQSE